MALLLLQTGNDHRVVHNMAATGRRGLRDICRSRPDHKPFGEWRIKLYIISLVVEIHVSTTLSWSNAAVSDE